MGNPPSFNLSTLHCHNGRTFSHPYHSSQGGNPYPELHVGVSVATPLGDPVELDQRRARTAGVPGAAPADSRIAKPVRLRPAQSPWRPNWLKVGLWSVEGTKKCKWNQSIFAARRPSFQGFSPSIGRPPVFHFGVYLLFRVGGHLGWVGRGSALKHLVLSCHFLQCHWDLGTCKSKGPKPSHVVESWRRFGDV